MDAINTLLLRQTIISIFFYDMLTFNIVVLPVSLQLICNKLIFIIRFRMSKTIMTHNESSDDCGK